MATEYGNGARDATGGSRPMTDRVSEDRKVRGALPGPSGAAFTRAASAATCARPRAGDQPLPTRSSLPDRTVDA
jgi:hypothetical protein